MKNTRAELQSQIKKLAETMRRQQHQKQVARKSSNASQDRAGLSFRSSKTGGGALNDREGKLLTSYSKSGFTGNHLLVNKQTS